MATEGFVDFRGHRTWYRIVGDLDASRPPLLALHGGPGSTHHYFAPLEQLADERAVVLYDQIGCGRSDRPNDLDWSVEVFRDELETVRSALGLERIHLLGTSWGGMLALEHVLAGALGIVGLILSSTLASTEEWVREMKRLRRELPPDVVATLDRHEAAGTYGDPEYANAEAVLMDRHFYRGPKPRPELERMAAERGADVYAAMIGPNEWTVTGPLKDWDVRGRLHEIDVPTLVIRGRHDMSTAAVAQTLVDGIRDVRHVVLEDSSHTPALEQTSEYLEAVRGFMRECEQ
ncbi:MAG: proline iminopeptidase-family hydrolase [Gaiellaceae bacterium]|jgi:L-proline amide hydrolase